MAKQLLKRKNTYYVRVVVPRPLQSTVGRREIQRTTGTGDLREAERRKHKIIDEIHTEIEVLTDNDPSSPSWLERQALGVRKAVSRGEIDSDVATEWIGVLREKHLKSNSLSPDGELPPETESRLRTITSFATRPEFTPLSMLIEQYIDESQAALRPSTVSAKQRRLDEFTEWLRDDPDINEINRKVTGKYTSDVLAGNGKHPSTNRDTITMLSSFWKWCINRGSYDHPNPWTGVANTLPSSTRGDRKLQVRKWSADELSALFKSISSGPKYYLKEMSAIALYTGMRQAEIAELEVTDVDLDAHVIHISEGKTQSSVRDVPVHSKLLPVISELVGERTKGYLFDTFKPAGRDLKRSHEFSKRFGYFRNKTFPDTVHVINEQGHKRSEVDFHSFRRSFISACEAAGVPEPTTKQLVGHSKSSLTYGTYSRGVDLELLRDAIEKVQFGDLDIPSTTEGEMV